MKNKILPCIIGIITGIANGFLGSGGGTVVVPCLEKFIDENSVVADLGCGSGILSVVALLLGAKSAFAVDIDANAIKTAYENADLSGVDKSKYYVTSGNVIDDKALQDEIGYDKYDVVVANIIADVICAISPVVPKQLKKGGVFIASGIIKDRIDDVYKAAPMALERLGAEVVAIHREPDGTNINLNCGSTHMEDLCQFVKENDDIQLGIAFDGDGDRCLACDGNGNMVDGDVVMAICAKHMKDNGKLKNNTIVATVMSNMGLFKMGRENGIKVERTKVGDRYVLEHILENGDCFGGEQSGHIIFFDYNTTGDGTLTAIQLLTTLKKQNQTLEEAKKIMEVFPQVLVNARVDNKRKKEYLSNETIKAEIEKLESKFSGEGRVLIRPSGTEPIVRVMIEGRDQSVLKEEAERLARLIEGLLS